MHAKHKWSLAGISARRRRGHSVSIMSVSATTRAYETTSRTVPEGIGLATASVGSVQFGAALAAELFPRVGPLGTVSLRLLGATLVLLALARPWRCAGRVASWARPCSSGSSSW